MPAWSIPVLPTTMLGPSLLLWSQHLLSQPTLTLFLTWQSYLGALAQVSGDRDLPTLPAGRPGTATSFCFRSRPAFARSAVPE